MRVGWLTLLRGGESCVVLAILSCRWSDEFFSTGRDVRSSDTRLLFRGWDVKGVPHESQRVVWWLEEEYCINENEDDIVFRS